MINNQNALYKQVSTIARSGEGKNALYEYSNLIGGYFANFDNIPVRSYCVAFMGYMARHVLTELQVQEDEGLSYHQYAIRIYPDNVFASCQVINLYKSLPWINVPFDDVRRCVQVVKDAETWLSDELRECVSDTLRELLRNVASQDERKELGL